MKSKLFILFVAAFALAASAAPMVTYDTNLSNFTGGCTSGTGTDVCTVGGDTLTYTPATGTFAPPSFVSLGDFKAAGTGNADFTGVTFILTLSQTTPAGTNSTVGTFAGAITGGGLTSDLRVTFTPVEFNVAGVIYHITNDAFGIDGTVAIPAPSLNLGATVQASTAIPEPATYALLSIGLLGLGIIRRRMTS